MFILVMKQGVGWFWTLKDYLKPIARRITYIMARVIYIFEEPAEDHSLYVDNVGYWVIT